MFFLLVSNSYAKEDFKRFSLYLELGGQGLLGSLNADVRFHPNFTFKAGFSSFLLGAGPIFSLSYISHANSSHHLEAGLGVNFWEVADVTGFLGGGGGEPTEEIVPAMLIGYRYQPKKGGFVFRLSFTPLFFIRGKEVLVDPNNPPGNRKKNRIRNTTLAGYFNWILFFMKFKFL